MNPKLIQVVQIVWSSDRRVLDAQGACQQLFHKPAPELRGLPLHVLLSISDEKSQEIDLKARRADSVQVEFVATSGITPARTFRMVLTHIGERALAGVMDLNGLLEGAPPLQLSRLASSLSHEIRNPLSSVKMAVQTIGKGTTLSERDTRRLAIAGREIRTIERTLWLLAEYGRDSSPTLEPVSLRSLVEESVALVEPELTDRKIRLKIEDRAVARIRADGTGLGRVLSQFLLNISLGYPEGSTLTVQVLPSKAGGYDLLIRDEFGDMTRTETFSLLKPFDPLLAHGATLCLASLHQVMRNHGGELMAQECKEGGALYTLHFRS